MSWRRKNKSRRKGKMVKLRKEAAHKMSCAVNRKGNFKTTKNERREE